MNGIDLLRIAMNRRAAFGVRRTFQAEQVVENLTVWNNVAAALDNLPTGGRARRELIAEVLDYVGLAGRRSASALRSMRASGVLSKSHAALSQAACW